MWKKCWMTLILLLLCFLLCSPAAFSAVGDHIVLHPDDIQAVMNGEELTMLQAPYVTARGNTMIPLRFLAESLMQAEVNWDSASNVVTLKTELTQLKIDLKTAKVSTPDEASIRLPEKVTVHDGVTFVPLRLISEQLFCQVDYIADPATITISQLDEADLRPVCGFTLSGAGFAGMPVYAETTSSDPQGRKIIDQIWKISYGAKSFYAQELQGNMKRPSAGEYHISYRVKNSMGIWSEWVEQDLEIRPNRAPSVSTLSANLSQPRCGDPVSFSYTYDNEAEEGVSVYSWQYSFQRDGEQFTVREQPRAFFAPGTYTVTLRLIDDYGQISEPKELVLTVSGTAISSLSYQFKNLEPGELYINHKKTDFNKLPSLEPDRIDSDPVTLLASNNPEKISSFGVLYADDAAGSVRIRYHHVNQTSSRLQIAVLVSNPTDHEVTVQLGKRGISGPSSDILQVGQYVVLKYLQSNYSKTLTLAPGTTRRINAEAGSIAPGLIESALIDVSCEEELHYSICALPSGSTDYDSLEPLDKIKTHVRGSFGNATIHLDYVTEGKQTEKIVLGREDAYENYYLLGIDALEETEITNNGNRGVLHQFTITADETVGILVNPRGSIFQGSIDFDGEICLLAKSGALLSNRDAVVLGVIPKGETRTLQYLAPSGSDSPILLLLIPEKDWAKGL